MSATQHLQRCPYCGQLKPYAANLYMMCGDCKEATAFEKARNPANRRTTASAERIANRKENRI